MASRMCGLELTHAVKQHKRLIPVVPHAIDASIVREPLASLNWIVFDSEASFAAAFDKLASAISTDLEQVRMHTRTLVRAIEWDRNQRDDSFLLRGSDLQTAVRWRDSVRVSRQPTDLQREYIHASEHWERGEIQRLQQLLDEAREQRRVAIAEKRKADRRLVDSYIAQGDALAQLVRWSEAAALYKRAGVTLKELGHSTALAEIPLWNAIRHSPPPLVRIAAKGTCSTPVSLAQGTRSSPWIATDTFDSSTSSRAEARPSIQIANQVTRAVIAPRLNRLFALTGDGRRLDTYEIAEPRQVASWRVAATATALGVSENGDIIVLAQRDGTIVLHDSATGKALQTLAGTERSCKRSR